MSREQIIFLSLFFLVVITLVLHMIAKHSLREVYAVVWVAVALAIPVNIILYPSIVSVGRLVGVQTPFNFSVFIGFVVCFGLLLHFSILNSGLQRNLKNAIQEIALLEGRIAELEKGRE